MSDTIIKFVENISKKYGENLSILVYLSSLFSSLIAVLKYKNIITNEDELLIIDDDNLINLMNTLLGD